jgi:hypothetical protein
LDMFETKNCMAKELYREIWSLYLLIINAL